MSFMLPQQLQRVVTALCDDIATPISATVKSLVERGEWVELQKLKISPSCYPDSESYFKDTIVCDLLRKCAMDSGIDTKAAAVETFWACERQNGQTNARLNRFLPQHLVIETPEDYAMSEFIGDWRKEILSVLKKLPDTLTPRFGKGSTYGDRGLLITVPDKMSSKPTMTEPIRDILPFWKETLWYSSLCAESPHLSQPEVVRGNRFSTVPKTGLTDRGICIEPSLNISFQLDVGRLMKNRLRLIGIDLLTGQQSHRERARESSVTGEESTIDLSNASDTICRVLVELLLPTAWYDLLNSLRSPFTWINGAWVRLEKFSSMGNGFTFELESLIFATLARVVVSREGGSPDRVSCYGDDLIVPQEHTESFPSALKFFGFTPNEKKTFTEGPFRESCGGDYFDGTPVRAHFLEKIPDEPQQWISLANGLRRLGLSDSRFPGRRHLVQRAWRRCLDAIPSNIRRLRGPAHLGDIVIHDDESTWQILRQGDQKSPLIFVWAPTPEVLPWHHWKPSTQLAAATLGYPSKGVTPRGGTSSFRIKRLPLWGSDYLPAPMRYRTE